MFEALNKIRAILTRREKYQLMALLVAVIAMALFQAAGVASILPFIGLVMEPNLVFDNQWLFMVYETLNFSSVSFFIVFVGIIMFLIILSSNAISALATWMKLRFVWMNNHRLSKRLLEKYLSMPYAFFLNQNSSELSKNVLNEVNQLTGNYLVPLLTIITRGLVAVFIIIMLFLINPLVSVVAVFFIGGIYTAIYWRVNRNIKQRGEMRIKANKMRFKIVSEAFGGIKEIKAMHVEPFFIDSYSRESYKHANQMSWNAVASYLPRYALEAIAFGGIIIFVLALLLSREDVRQVIPIISVFAFAGYRLMPSIQDLFTNYTQLKFNQVVLDRIYEDITARDESVSSLKYSKYSISVPLAFKKEIRLDNISFTYPNSSSPVIKDIGMSIKHNTSIGLVGPTGAGKTTLVDILLGLLLPDKGSMLIDDQVVNFQNIERWQKTLGYVPQNIFLVDDTLARNIALGLPDSEIDQLQLERVSRIANIHDFIAEELPEGYNTVVGERGIRLSGGQRQRIGIARALYHDPEVLVFDEATSALDGVTEGVVLNAMDNVARSKTLIIIAHRLTTVKNCDMVYILDHGKIVARGTYDELLESNEQFKKMAKIGSSN